MKDKLTILKEALADWQQRKTQAEARLALFNRTLLEAAMNGSLDGIIYNINDCILKAQSDLNIAEWQIAGITGAIQYAEGCAAGMIDPGAGHEHEGVDDLRAELLR